MSALERSVVATAKRSRSLADWVMTAVTSVVSLLGTAQLLLFSAWSALTIGGEPTPDQQVDANRWFLLACAVFVLGVIGPWVVRRVWYATAILGVMTVTVLIASLIED